MDEEGTYIATSLCSLGLGKCLSVSIVHCVGGVLGIGLFLCVGLLLRFSLLLCVCLFLLAVGSVQL